MSKHINLSLETELTEVALSDLLYEIERRSELKLDGVETDELIDALEFRGYDIYSSDWDLIKESGDWELMDELSSRGYTIKDADDDIAEAMLYRLYELKSSNSNQFEKAFADMIYKSIGRIL